MRTIWTTDRMRLFWHNSDGGSYISGVTSLQIAWSDEKLAEAILSVALPLEDKLRGMKVGDRFSITYGICRDPSIYREEEVVLSLGVLSSVRFLTTLMSSPQNDRMIEMEMTFPCTLTFADNLVEE